MYHDLKDKGFEILDVPCDQFGHQAPGSDEEIHEFCTAKFGVDFPQFKKSEVNGANELPLYTWLKSEKGYAGGAYEEKLAAIMGRPLQQGKHRATQAERHPVELTKFLVTAMVRLLHVSSLQ